MPSGTFFIDSFSFFTDVDCCIHIPVHPISTFTNIHSIRQCQFLFLMSAYTADLAGCKITVYFYKMFSAFFQLVSQHEQKLTVPVILHTFPKVQPSGHSLQIQIFHTYCIISYAGNLFSGSLSFHDIKLPFFSVSDSSGFLFHSGRAFSVLLQVFSLLFCKT